eukprot:CAMPEP_0185723834 /NCGR_PEP_ID=MMETSP1171-20130828/539_1 /TAXON_ID=374046 /ORGANISM="Helicotheca tamensis, Strain CCMP826" /LENGTH=443 /DNA_ID=CAMNT_0028391589 /DNA_START=26 /DNA_END=1357 /DNA_ORIENTATION=+
MALLVPADVLLAFFKDATTLMENHPQKETLPHLMSDEDAIPPTLEKQRQVLLGVQVSALERAVADYNSNTSKGDDVTVESAQLALRELGGGGETKLIEPFDDESKQNLTLAMSVMNDVARVAFARAVLMLEFQWDQKMSDEGEGDGQDTSNIRNLRGAGEGTSSIDRAHVLEFCGLCNVAVKIPQVQRYLRDGTDLLLLFDETTNGDEGAVEKAANTKTENSLSTAKDRLENIQKVILRALGYEPQFAMDEFRRLFLSKESDTEMDDLELVDIFSKFVQSMMVVLTNATLGISTDFNGLPSDKDEGGVTRVVSVQQSEAFVDVGGGDDGRPNGHTVAPPPRATMEQQRDAFQKEQIEMARQAATVREGMLGELIAMDEKEREATLKDAKERHDSFMEQANQLPEGPARFMLMARLDKETQRALVIHKLWEKMLEENGGQAPAH